LPGSASICLDAGRCSITTSRASERYTVAGKDKIAPGRHVVTLDFNYDGRAWAKAVRRHSPWTVRSCQRAPAADYAYRMSLDETLDIGEDTGNAD